MCQVRRSQSTAHVVGGGGVCAYPAGSARVTCRQCCGCLRKAGAAGALHCQGPTGLKCCASLLLCLQEVVDVSPSLRELYGAADGTSVGAVLLQRRPLLHRCGLLHGDPGLLAKVPLHRQCP